MLISCKGTKKSWKLKVESRKLSHKMLKKRKNTDACPF